MERVKLNKLSLQDIKRVREERQRAGALKYGDKHLKRDNLLDVMEELLDAHNILQLAKDRHIKQLGIEIMPKEFQVFQKLLTELTSYLLFELAEVWPKELMTDEEGGERIGW